MSHVLTQPVPVKTLGEQHTANEQHHSLHFRGNCPINSNLSNSVPFNSKKCVNEVRWDKCLQLDQSYIGSTLRALLREREHSKDNPVFFSSKTNAVEKSKSTSSIGHVATRHLEFTEALIIKRDHTSVWSMKMMNFCHFGFVYWMSTHNSIIW